MDIPADGKAHYPDFNWKDLVAQKKALEAKQKEVVDPPSSDDANDEFKAICREFDDYIKNSQEKIDKGEISDKEKYLLSYKIDTLREINQ